MRILHVTDAYLPRAGGIEMHVRDLANAQIAAGDEVDIITMTSIRSGVSTLDLPAIPKVIRPGSAAGYIAKGRFLAQNRSYGANGGYDVVHAHCSTISLLSFFALGTPGVPRVMTVHSFWQRYNVLYRAFDHALDWSSWPVTWSAVSQVAADGIHKAARNAVDVAILPNGINLELWNPGPRARDPKQLRILAVMRLSTRKRPLTLLRVLRSVRARVPAEIELSVTILGDGPSRWQMELYLERHGMTGWVHLPGHLPRSEVKKVMARSDVFVAPAKLESFGIAALEAHAAGLPVVGRSGNGLSQFIHNGEGGFLVDTDQEMVSVLARMATDRPPESVPRSSSLKNFEWPAVVQRHHELYEQAGVAPGRRGSRSAQVTRVS